MATRTMIVLGGALAGPAAAARLRELDEDARIVMIERGPRISYAMSGLAFYLSGEVESISRLDQERADFFESVYRVEVRTCCHAESLDAAKQTLHVRHGDRRESLAYDALIFALGAESVVPENLHETYTNVVRFRTLDDLKTIEQTLQSGKKRTVVVGGGPMGLEAADGLLRAGADVTLIERGSLILPQFSVHTARQAEQLLARSMTIMTSTQVENIQGSGDKCDGVRLTDGRFVPADLVVVTAGLSPRTAIFAAAGGKVAGDGSVIVNKRCETSLPKVYACGVCVSTPQAITGKPVWTPQAALADKTAQIAAHNAAGITRELPPAAGSMLVRIKDLFVGKTGLAQDDAEKFCGRDNVAVTSIVAPAIERYIKGSTELMVTLIWNKKDGRILGIEAGGAAGVDKTIDIGATAILGGLTIEQLAFLDFAYIPPLSPQRSAINTVTTVAALERDGLGHEIGVVELASSLEEYQLLNVGSETGTAAAAFPEAQLVPLETLRSKLGEIRSAKPIVTISETGRRAWLAARILYHHGFKDVKHLSGGHRAWRLAQHGK